MIPPQEIELRDQLARDIPPECKLVLKNLTFHMCYPIADTASNCRMPLKEFRKHLKELKINGLVDYVFLKEEDGDMLRGWGYVRTARGSAILKRKYEHFEDNEW